MHPTQRWIGLPVNVPFSQTPIWIYRIWCVIAIASLIGVYFVESAVEALILFPVVPVLLAAIEVMAWSSRKKTAQVAEAGISLDAVVTGKGVTWRGGVPWVSAEYTVGGQKTESTAYVSHRALHRCRIGGHLPIRVLQASPRFWIPESDVGEKR